MSVFRLSSAAVVVAACLVAGCKSADSAARDESPSDVLQLSFDSPRDALRAFTNALLTDDREYLHEIFGPEVDELSSGDPERDSLEKERLGIALAEGGDVRRGPDGAYLIVVPEKDFEFPVPIVRVKGRWMFDTLAGVEEMENIRIGFNELRTIRFLRALPAAQAEYALFDHDADGMLEFAARLRSTEGLHDGLYWPNDPDAPVSPLGPIAASGEGHLSELQGYNGYFFRVLTKQGRGAPGGVKDYMSGGNLVGGFAVLAYPSFQDETGVMWFLVGADGVVYERLPSADEKGHPDRITEFDPSQGWSRVVD